jgi:hypothetical protein
MKHPALKLVCVAAGFILGGCARGPRDSVTVRYDKPLTYAQAAKKKDITFPLPESAHNIYFGGFWGGQAYTMVVRFDAPTNDCIKHIGTALAWDDRIYNRTSSYPRVAVTNVAPVDAGFLTPTRWFNPDKITHGIYAGVWGSHTPQIWVDWDKGVFYFRETD